MPVPPRFCLLDSPLPAPTLFKKAYAHLTEFVIKHHSAFQSVRPKCHRCSCCCVSLVDGRQPCRTQDRQQRHVQTHLRWAQHVTGSFQRVVGQQSVTYHPRHASWSKPPIWRPFVCFRCRVFPPGGCVGRTHAAHFQCRHRRRRKLCEVSPKCQCGARDVSVQVLSIAEHDDALGEQV